MYEFQIHYAYQLMRKRSWFGNKPFCKNEDIISIDCGSIMNEYYGDHAYTFTVGEVKEDIKKLLK